MNPFREFNIGDVLCKIGESDKFVVEEVCFYYYSCRNTSDNTQRDIIKKFAHEDYVKLENVHEDREC